MYVRLCVCTIFYLRSTNKLSTALQLQDDAVKNRSDIDQDCSVTAIVTVVPTWSEPIHISLHLSLSFLFRDVQWDTQACVFCGRVSALVHACDPVPQRT